MSATTDEETLTVPQIDDRAKRLATAVSTIILRRPLQLIGVVGPAIGFCLTWNIYLAETARITQVTGAHSPSLNAIVLILVLLAALWSFGIGHLAHRMEDRRFWLDKSVGVGATLERLSEEKSAAQKDLQSAHTQLAERAGQLEDANNRLLELDTLKSKFVAEVGHELRAPLAAIVSAANIILRHHTKKPEAVDRFGTTIVTEGKRLARLVNDLLDLTKIEADCVEWDDRDTDINELVHQAMLGIEPVALEAQVVLATEFQADMPSLCIDRDRILQILTNLLNNALKFTPKAGTITLRVSHNDREVVFAVRDSGAGIPDEDQPLIFNRFAQSSAPKAEHDASVSVGSTGLGLCISKEIVEHYGGRIWVASKVNTGSTFSFTIPLDPVTTSRADTAAMVVPQLRPLSVFALLENDEMADRIRDIDPSTSITCQAFNSINNLAAAVSSSTPDAVLMSKSLVPEPRSPLFEAMQSHGMTELLVHTDDGAIRTRAVRDSTVIVVRKLRYYANVGSTILLVDDDQNFLEIVEWELRHAGYEVKTAKDGHAALEILGSEKIDAVLLDYMLPLVDGLSVLESLTKFTKKVPVIMLTAMADDEVAAAAKTLGAVDVIRKDGVEPSSSTHALARIQRALRPVLRCDENV